MAKLSKQVAQQAEAQADDWSGAGVVPPGVYLCKLSEVDSSKSGPAGPYWVWTYEAVGVQDEPKGKKFWDNTSLSEKAVGRLGKVFEAFGVPTDTDTDDMIGMLCAVEVKIGTINQGDRAGEQRNEVVMVHSADVHAYVDEFLAANPPESASAEDFD